MAAISCLPVLRRHSTVDKQHVAVAHAGPGHRIAQGPHHEGRLRVPDQRVVQVDALGCEVAAR
jgi:hypothetical protein